MFRWIMQAFTEAGLDSLGAVELRNALSQHLDMELPATLAFDHPSINAIATYIFASMGGGDETLEMVVSASRAYSYQSSSHSVQSGFASSSVTTKPHSKVTEIFAMSSRLPSPAGMLLALGLYCFIHNELGICKRCNVTTFRTWYFCLIPDTMAQGMVTTASLMLFPFAPIYNTQYRLIDGIRTLYIVHT